jgi:hypothetical protein
MGNTDCIYAHKVVLCAQSEYFSAMFGGGMRESGAAEVTINETRFHVFLSMLEFLYTGQIHDTDVTDLHPDLAVELLAAANEYSLKRLKACCEVALSKQIEIDTVAGLFQVRICAAATAAHCC